MLNTPPREGTVLGEEAPHGDDTPQAEGAPRVQVPTPGSKAERSAELLKPEKWPTPKWFVEKKTKNTPTYEQYFTVQLRARYVELENEFRSVLGNYPCTDLVTAERISDILHSARESLHVENTELLTVSCSLNLAERYMVWLYPRWVAKVKIDGLLFKLQSLSINGRDFLIQQVTKLSESADKASPGHIASVLDETIGAINTQVTHERISSSLQIHRLRVLRSWGLIILLMFWAAAPLATNLKNIGDDWPSSQLFIENFSGVYTWINAFAMMLLGAVGGFISGLLQARCTQVTLTEYLENMIKLQLRPLVGALVALILYTFLSWKVLPGIVIENAGSFFVIAFLSGFSERYFLQLLKTDPEEPGEETKAEPAEREKVNRPKQVNLTGL